MNALFSAAASLHSLLAGARTIAFSSEPEKSKSFFEALGSNIWYIVLVILFGAGLLLITKWSAKIKERDRKAAEEYEEWKKANPEKAQLFEMAQDGMTPEEQDASAETGDAPTAGTEAEGANTGESEPENGAVEASDENA